MSSRGFPLAEMTMKAAGAVDALNLISMNLLATLVINLVGWLVTSGAWRFWMRGTGRREVRVLAQV